MSVGTVLSPEEAGFLWLDVTAPTPEELQALAARFGLHPTSVQDSLEPAHLPKYERIGDHVFVIVRAYDPKGGARGDTVQEITRKVAIFLGPTFLITVHRAELPFLTALIERYQRHDWLATTAIEVREALLPHLLVDLLRGVVDSYTKPLEILEGELDTYENNAFNQRDFAINLRRAYHVKRRISLIKRLLWRSFDVVQHLTPAAAAAGPEYQDLRESVDSLRFYADELLEEADSLVSIQLALAAHRTNDVVRVLTVFSAFFLPLTFIVGIYGMNFRFMPELGHRWGYPLIWLVMLSVTLAIFIWMRRRGWLR